ncbi:hypothetical protein CK203_083166 [Vitis vinifera]|uniref:Uncharacterized protein n=1 Tax=Vitis vinifera TaxID=29760 RepID=A0A438DWM7_VITVI|nr:hypothetical protein CK203_083166 [Vitis vinifera]
MDIVSSHSWSHSNQKMRKLTSLSRKILSNKVGENAKKLKGSLSERNRSENRAKTEQKQGRNRAMRDFAA